MAYFISDRLAKVKQTVVGFSKTCPFAMLFRSQHMNFLNTKDFCTTIRDDMLSRRLPL